LLRAEGMTEESYRTVHGLYHVIYESKGYWFRTPEAWDVTGNFRASMYMRPAAIWALEMTRSIPPTTSSPTSFNAPASLNPPAAPASAQLPKPEAQEGKLQ